MRCVTYARVSTLRQESEGESIENQNRAFTRAQARYGWDLVSHYQEAASAKSVAGRAEFSRMIAELPHTKPDCIVVDTLDRFTRNLEDGLRMLRELRGHRVGLLPLDWMRREPIDLDNDADWQQVVAEFTAAERERRRIRARMNRSFEGRKERGATTVNHPAFGLRKVGDLLRPDAENAWIIDELEKRALLGEPFQALARWAREITGGRWGAIKTIRDVLGNENYVLAGARTPERHRALRDLLEQRSSRYAQQRRHENEFTGVFLCGHCADQGKRKVMTATWKRDERGGARPVLNCPRTATEKRDGTRHNFEVNQAKVEPRFWSYVDAFAADPRLLRRWAAQHSEASAEVARQLTARLGKLDQEAAALKSRRDRAFDLVSDPSAAVQRQARKMLADVDRDEMQLAVTRQAILSELARQDDVTPRDADALRVQLERYREVYDAEPVRSRNALNRALCDLVGSHPRVYRANRGAQVIVRWPELEPVHHRKPARR